MKIYGNGDLVDDIMDGTNFGDGKYKIKKD